MSLRDGLVQVLGNDLANAAMPIIERAIAAERAATIEECTALLPDPTSHLDYWNSLKAQFDALPRDRSALDTLLAQARAGQREKDKGIADAIIAREEAALKDWDPITEGDSESWWTHTEAKAVAREISAAIRGQK